MRFFIGFTFYVFLFSVPQFAFSQIPNNQIDSMLELLKYQKADTNQVILLNEIAVKFYNTSPDSALIFAEEALNLAFKNNYDRGIGYSYGILAKIYFLKNDYDISLQNYFNALKYSDKSNDSESLISIYNDIAIIYFEIPDLNNSLEYFNKALNIFDENDLSLQKASMLLYVGSLYEKLDSADMAMNFYEKSLRIKDLHNDSLGIAICSNNIGNILYNQKKYSKALKFFLEAESFIFRTDDYKEKTIIYTNIASVYSDIGKTWSAEKYFNKALEAAISSESPEITMEVYNDQFQHFYKYKNFKKAFFSLKSFYKLKDSIFSIKTDNKIAELTKDFENDKKEKENIVIKAKEAQNDAILRQQEYFGYLIVGILFFSVTTVFLILVIALQRKKAHSQIALKDAKIAEQEVIIKNQNSNKK